MRARQCNRKTFVQLRSRLHRTHNSLNATKALRPVRTTSTRNGLPIPRTQPAKWWRRLTRTTVGTTEAPIPHPQEGAVTPSTPLNACRTSGRARPGDPRLNPPSFLNSKSIIGSHEPALADARHDRDITAGSKYRRGATEDTQRLACRLRRMPAPNGAVVLDRTHNLFNGAVRFQRRTGVVVRMRITRLGLTPLARDTAVGARAGVFRRQHALVRISRARGCASHCMGRWSGIWSG